ncbi:alpha/beta fold hydrolase [Pseudooceanicola sp. LIPI14-2-Ac024]|uniref:alpha/beta fold hydrolase n=1 Tax=Pseudooceanicola sp. LIPI14-2-Ac024 TaxID=3344875 RepID=UPI0035D10AE1
MPDGLLGGVETHWRELGQGARPMLAVHCSLAHGGAFQGLSEEIGDLVTMRAYDLPGHGGSADWDGVTPYQDVACAMGRELMGEGPIHLLGHSFGATVALRLAVEAPERVASLTLIETVFFSIVRADAPETLGEGDGNNRPFMQAMERGDLETAARAFHAEWGDGRNWDEMTDRQRAGLTRRIPMIGAVQRSNNGDPGNMLAERKLEALQIPTLLIEGADSPPHMRIIQGGLERRIPNATRVIVPGAAHMVPITHPAPVGAAIRDFLTNLDA